MDCLGSVLLSGIRGGITPGLSAAIVSHPNGREATVKEYYLGREHLGGRKVSAETVYDLASMTKVFCTTVLAAKAIGEGHVGLLERPWQQWPSMTVQSVLAHTSGLPWWHNLSKNPDEIYSLALDLSKLGIRVYSDIGYILVGRLLEERTGKTLDGLFAEISNYEFKTDEVYFMRDSNHVNDKNCRAMNCVAGHAGLFGTLRGVLACANWILRAIQRPCTTTEQILAYMSEQRIPGPIGFDFQTAGRSTGGFLSDQAVGHLGFTGTSVWMDPGSSVHQMAVYVLLTNRLECGDFPKKIRRLRQDFQRLAVLKN